MHADCHAKSNTLYNRVELAKRQPDRSMDRKESLERVPGIYEVIYDTGDISHH